jgi:hypothetical protein
MIAGIEPIKGAHNRALTTGRLPLTLRERRESSEANGGLLTADP